jgi:hypothetical protein
MKKIFFIVFLWFITIESFSQQHSVTSSPNGSIGTMFGSPFMLENMNGFTGFAHGGWIEYDNIGFEYTRTATVTNNIYPQNYINGKIGKWIAGGVSSSFGVFLKNIDGGLYVGTGIQVSVSSGLENVLSQKINFPKQNSNVIYVSAVGSQGKSSVSKTPSKPNTTIETYTESKVLNERKTTPYLTLGYMKNLSDLFVFRGGIIISKYTSVNIGLGLNF